jgi:hypothetical protein
MPETTASTCARCWDPRPEFDDLTSPATVPTGHPRKSGSCQPAGMDSGRTEVAWTDLRGRARCPGCRRRNPGQRPARASSHRRACPSAAHRCRTPSVPRPSTNGSEARGAAAGTSTGRAGSARRFHRRARGGGTERLQEIGDGL